MPKCLCNRSSHQSRGPCAHFHLPSLLLQETRTGLGPRGLASGLLPLPRENANPAHSCHTAPRAQHSTPSESREPWPPRAAELSLLIHPQDPWTQYSGAGMASQPVIQTSINFLEIQGLRLPKPAQPFTRVRVRDDPAARKFCPGAQEEAGPGCA